MTLKALVLCSDEKILRVLRRVLSDLEIGLEHCPDADSAIQRLTRQRFEALIVDCSEPATAALVLKSARTAPCNKRAVAVAIIDGTTGVRSAFEMGAHFALYKPISTERAKASFRAARALMKRERRRNSRLSVQIPVSVSGARIGTAQQAMTVDFSEGGMAVQFKYKVRETGPLSFVFTLPGVAQEVALKGEIAWESPNNLLGIRFVDVPPDLKHLLKTWFNQNSAEPDKDDPPVRCRLTDLSLGGCYLEIVAPFPARTRVVLSMRVHELELRADGVVRVVHPDAGMGIEFTQATPEQRQHVERFIEMLRNNRGGPPDLLVEPEGLEPDAPEVVSSPILSDHDDPLLDLFRTKSNVPVESFLRELRKQRHSQTADSSEIILEA
jgi:c-di-GMP-binding flagellar brake protein YcgR